MELNDECIFAEGGRRIVYVCTYNKHPNNLTKIIKITKQDDLLERKRKAKFFKKIRPLRCFDENYEDFTAYKIYEKMPKEIYDIIPKSFGMVETNKGMGFVTELIKNYDGSNCLTLKQYIEKYGFDSKIQNAIKVLEEKMLKLCFISRELKDFNLVVKKLNENDICIYIIDGFGNQEFIPFSRWFKFVARRKIKKHMKKFLKNLKKEKITISA